MESIAILEGLLQLSLATRDAHSLDDVSAVLSERSKSLVGAANAAIGVVTLAGDAIRVYQGPTATQGTAPIRLVGLAEPTPLTDAIRACEPVLVKSADEFASLYPAIWRRIEPGELTAMATYPLESGDRVVGACFFRFTQEEPVTSEQYSVMEKIVPHVGRAVGRIIDRAELARHVERLAQSNRDLDNFAAVVAHDLSAPVRRTGSYFQLLLRELGELPPKANGYAKTITSQTSHLNNLLQDTLAYAQVTAPTDTRQAVDLNTLVNETIEPMNSELGEIAATIEIGDLPVVHVEASLIRQVVQNLVDNAIKYRNHDRALRIVIQAEFHEHTASDHRSWWKITFSDNGIGIDPDRTDEVFNMFSRLEISDERPGTGVGLALIKRVIERHGGRVGVEPGLDGGTTIWFLLPGVAAPDIL